MQHGLFGTIGIILAEDENRGNLISLTSFDSHPQRSFRVAQKLYILTLEPTCSFRCRDHPIILSSD